MKHPSLPVKRRSSKKGAFSTLFVNVAKKRHRASTSAAPMPEMEGDVPNVGVARALVVILAIHVVAIAGIFIHSRYFETKTEGGSTSKLSVVPQKVAEANGQVKLKEGEMGHLILTGESYTTIARDEKVDLKELQDLNNNIGLQVGKLLRLPAKQITAMEPPQMAAARQGQNSDGMLPVNTLTSPSSLTSATGHDSIRDTPPMVETTAAAKVPRAIIVKPAVKGDDEPATTSRSKREEKSSAKVAANNSSKPKDTKGASEGKASVAAKKPAATSSSKRVVKSGDTLWSIAKANGTTPAALMKANGIKDASKMRVGMELSIPKGN